VTTVPEAEPSSSVASAGLQSEQTPVDEDISEAASSSASEMSLEEKKERFLSSL